MGGPGRRLMPSVSPTSVLDTCLNGGNLVAAMNLTGVLEPITGEDSGPDFSELDKLDMDKAFEFPDYYELKGRVMGLDLATFKWSQADRDQLDKTCTQCVEFDKSMAVKSQPGR